MTAAARHPEPTNKRRAVTFTVPGIPAPAGSKRAFVNRRTGGVIVTDDSKRSRPWKTDVAATATDAGLERLLEGPLALVVTFYLPRPRNHFGKGRNAGTVREGAPPFPAVRPDITKLVRAVEDALTGIIWRDDAQIVAQDVAKFYGEPARCMVSVRELPDEPAT